ncbi:hypothetical protein BGX23_004939 [Mortierella sp. AD031]|nr:hypothetical protein BGX23_004939 [Mortierella sp. AD031]
MMYELLKEWRDKRAALNKNQDALKAGSCLDRELPRPSSQELETTLVKAEEHVKTLACDMGKEESILSAMVEALLRGEKSALDHDIPAAAQLKDPNADGDLENKDTQVGDDGKDVKDA